MGGSPRPPYNYLVGGWFEVKKSSCRSSPLKQADRHLLNRTYYYIRRWLVGLALQNGSTCPPIFEAATCKKFSLVTVEFSPRQTQNVTVT